jgi:hypothetical protein
MATFGNDIWNGDGANDNMDGLAGNDYLNGGAGNDTLIGGLDNDTLIGGEANDSLTGGDGNDILIGGAGNNTLYGNAGNDIFHFNDFSHSFVADYKVGEDKIEVHISELPPKSLDTSGTGTDGTGNPPRVKFKFFFDSSNGFLFYDPDGKGPSQPVKIATLSTGIVAKDLSISVVALTPSGSYENFQVPVMDFQDWLKPSSTDISALNKNPWGISQWDGILGINPLINQNPDLLFHSTGVADINLTALF